MNPKYHYETTGKEIYNLNIDSLIGSVSTGGHLCGVAKLIKDQNKDINIIACDVKGSAVFSDKFSPYLINGVGLGWKSKNTDLSLIDKFLIANDEEAISICHMLAKEHGILIGGSGGLSVFSALAWLHSSNANTALAIIPDTGVNYLDQYYNIDWLVSKNINILNKNELSKSITTKKFNTSTISM